ncbi:hypothetical protein H4R23_002055 [Coemansia sp. Cherry 401B]|nr:hypothetical protein H4R23_002055 [Coemansia sp. Cherry 401B]
MSPELTAATPRSILCLAPNPAYQITVLFDEIVLGDVNRATQQTNSLGGKGQNFAVATKQFLGTADHVLLLQILGGPTGDQIQALEDQQGFSYQTVRSQLPTRTCTTCLDARSGEMTEMVGVSGTIDAAVEVEYAQAAIDILQNDPPRAMALCGTFPPGLCGETMARIILQRRPDTLIFVDAVKDIQPVLATRCIDILKVNSTEVLSILSSLDMQYQAKRPADVDLAQAAVTLGRHFNIGVVAVTDGPETAYLADIRKNACWAFKLPDLLAQRTELVDKANAHYGQLLLNPLGAGDTCSAVMLNLLLDGNDIVECFAQGLAAASASCLVPMPNCVFEKSAMQKIRNQITIAKL